MWEILRKAGEEDLIFFCLTGGASSLLVKPAAGLSLKDKIKLNRLLLACGADIAEVNVLRKHLSQIKGGGAARVAFPATVVSLIISDVISDDLGTIGSGPTAPDPTSFVQAWKIVEQYKLVEALPKPVLQRLQHGVSGRISETPKPDDPAFTRVHNLLIGHNRLALDAAVKTARALGYTPQVFTAQLRGDTGEAAHAFARTLREALCPGQPPLCLLAGGETTVRVTGTGKGGRNQEFALVVACELAEKKGWTLLSAGTDGIDGPTDAAGAFVDGTTVRRARDRGLDPLVFLVDKDSYHFFSALGDLFCPGLTGTNVMDIKIALLQP
jgi:hydroxypyruvate reductase